MLKRIFLGCLIVILFAEIGAADTLVLRGGDKIYGLILDAKEDAVLFKSANAEGVFVSSYSKTEIYSIELKEFTFPEEFMIYDRLVLRGGTSFLGKVEVETPDALYFSLKLDDGVGIVEFDRDNVVAIEGTYGIKKFFGTMYYKWKYFVYDFVEFTNKKLSVAGQSTVGGVSLQNFLMDIEKEEAASGEVGERRTFTPRTLKIFLGANYFVNRDALYELGVQEKQVLMGMNKLQVGSILREIPAIKQNGDIEKWSYPSGITVDFHMEKVSGYTKKNREKIVQDVKRYYGDKL